MSYSFTVRAATRACVKDMVRAKLEEVMRQQECHQLDVDAALANSFACIDMVPEDSERDLVVICSGYVSWAGSWGADQRITGVRIDCVVNQQARLPG